MALFDRFDHPHHLKSLLPPSTQGKRCFSKTLFKPEEFENAGFPFSCGQKTFWKRTELFENDVVWTENICRIFSVKPPFSNSSGVVRTRPYSKRILRSVGVQ